MKHASRPPQKQGNPAVSLAGKAYSAIRDRVLKGEYPLGAALSRRKLAAELNMSFIPITDALQRLESEGLVESKPRVGTRVRIPTESGIRDLYILREALETQAARLFAERSCAEEKQELSRMGRHLDRLYEACANEMPDADFLFSVHTYHMNLHMRVAESARCNALRDAIQTQQVLIFNWLYDTAAQRRDLPPHFHTDLAEALCSGKVEAADAEMRRHIQCGLDQVLQRISALGSTGENGWRMKKT